MGLAPGEQRTLTEIESQLRRTDPDLVATFALFASQGRQRRGRIGGFLAQWAMRRLGVIPIIVFAVVAAVLAVCLAVGIYVTCRHAGTAPGTHEPGSVVPRILHLLAYRINNYLPWIALQEGS